ncbi:MarR family winged helix-turn-helix transcriptional regulator [Lentzea sp. CA-135723]|uniref:MarR family winged helix-turn-helix transcriptional regulator n=1 Tax=Lentzea sp. CA-135723 TaxID=3239950 RepID=UPI003D8AEBF7
MNIGLLLFIPNRDVENRVLAAVNAAGFDVTQAQARVLMRVGPDGTRLTVLAEAAQVTKQTAGFLVDQLEKSGYVERVPDPADGRARLVRVTEKALDAVPVANAELAKIEAEWERHLGKRRMTQLREALEMLGEITDPYR